MSGDFNGDGRLDVAATDADTSEVSVFLDDGNGTFSPPAEIAAAVEPRPFVADINGDGTDDVLVVDSAGQVLYRQGIPGQPGSFDPPVIVNPGDPAPRYRLVPDSAEGPLLASVDADDDAVSLYASATAVSSAWRSLATGQLPAQIIAADLTGDGGTTWSSATPATARSRSSSTTAKAASDQLQPFLRPLTLSIGAGVSDVQAVDTTGDGLLDLVATNKLTGQVSILRNLGNGSSPLPCPTAPGPACPRSTNRRLVADHEPGGDGRRGRRPVHAGRPADLVTINPGSNSSTSSPGWAAAGSPTPMSIPTQAVPWCPHGRPHRQRGRRPRRPHPDRLDASTWATARGASLPPTTYACRPDADGLTVADVNHDGKLDLLVGNAYGDVLVLLGNGDGTFAPYHNTNQSVELAVADLTGNGATDFIYADQGLDRVVVEYGAGRRPSWPTGRRAARSRRGELADLNGDGIPDLIVANSGSNNVLVYPGLGNGQFGPAINGGNGFFTGTDPVGITVADLTGVRPDLVIANKGSNDVSILLEYVAAGRRHLVQGRPAAECRRLGSGVHGGRELHRRPRSRPAGHQQRVERRHAPAGRRAGLLRRPGSADLRGGHGARRQLRRQLQRSARPRDRQRRFQRPDGDLRLRKLEPGRVHPLVGWPGSDDGVRFQRR